MDDEFKKAYLDISANVKKLRKRLGYTERDMAEILSIDPLYYSRLERCDDNRHFTLEQVLIICSVFKLKPGDLITRLPDLSDKYCVTLKKDIMDKLQTLDGRNLSLVQMYIRSINKEDLSVNGTN